MSGISTNALSAIGSLALIGCAFLSVAGCGDDAGGQLGASGGAQASGGQSGFAAGGTGGAGPTGVGGSAGGIDCTTTSAASCLAAEGVYNGTPFACMGVGFSGKGLIPTAAWVIRCETAEILVEVQFPVQQAGPISYTGSVRGFSFRVVNASEPGAMKSSSGNLASGTLTGTLDAATFATGTLIAAWSAPSVGCVSTDDFAPKPCAAGNVKMTFHAQLKP